MYHGSAPPWQRKRTDHKSVLHSCCTYHLEPGAWRRLLLLLVRPRQLEPPRQSSIQQCAACTQLQDDPHLNTDTQHRAGDLMDQAATRTFCT